MAGTVTVASKLPLPLKLQLQTKTERLEQTLSGDPRVVESFVKSGKTVIINGCALDRGKPSEKALVDGFALTYNVDADFWKEWVAQNSGFPPLMDGLIFAHEKPGSTEGEARNRHALRSGLEPLDPENMPPEFKARIGKAA